MLVFKVDLAQAPEGPDTEENEGVAIEDGLKEDVGLFFDVGFGFFGERYDGSRLRVEEEAELVRG